MQSNAERCNATQRDAKRCRAMQGDAERCNAMQNVAMMRKHRKAMRCKYELYKALETDAKRCDAKFAIHFHYKVMQSDALQARAL
jgi:hypothetical protein